MTALSDDVKRTNSVRLPQPVLDGRDGTVKATKDMNHSITINLHDLVELSIATLNPGLDDMLGNLGDIPQLVARFSSAGRNGNAERPQVKILYADPLRAPHLRELSHHVFVAPGVLLDTKYRVRLESPAPRVFALTSSSACMEWAAWAIQLALLQAGTTFVHSVGVAMNGKAFLFPSWGGIGKTAIAEGFVRHLGWKLLGDDLVILSQEGICFGFPQPMVLYPYHRYVFPELFAAGNGPIAPISLNNVLTSAALAVKPFLRAFPSLLQFARRHNPQSIRVKPSTVFGMQNLAQYARLTATVWLDRVVGINEATLVPADSSIASRIVSSTLYESDPWCANLTNIACGLGIITFRDVYSAWLDIVERGVATGSAWMLSIPADMPVQDVPGVVHAALGRAGLLDGVA